MGWTTYQLVQTIVQQQDGFNVAKRLWVHPHDTTPKFRKRAVQFSIPPQGQAIKSPSDKKPWSRRRRSRQRWQGQMQTSKTTISGFFGKWKKRKTERNMGRWDFFERNKDQGSTIDLVLGLLSTNKNGHFPSFCMPVVLCAFLTSSVHSENLQRGNWEMNAKSLPQCNKGWWDAPKCFFATSEPDSDTVIYGNLLDSQNIEISHLVSCSPVDRSFEISRSKPNGRTLDQMRWSTAGSICFVEDLARKITFTSVWDSICTLFNAVVDLARSRCPQVWL